MEVMIQNINKHRKLYLSVIFIGELMMIFAFPTKVSFSSYTVMYFASLLAFGFIDYLFFTANWRKAALFSSVVFILGFTARLLIEWGEVSMAEYLSATNVAITVASYAIAVSAGYTITLTANRRTS